MDKVGSGRNRLNSTLESEELTGFYEEVEYDNQLVQDLVNYVCTWNWKVSAAGIFDIDKALLSGVSSFNPMSFYLRIYKPCNHNYGL